jgi:hypothetical protein
VEFGRENPTGVSGTKFVVNMSRLLHRMPNLAVDGSPEKVPNTGVNQAPRQTIGRVACAGNTRQKVPLRA